MKTKNLYPYLIVTVWTIVNYLIHDNVWNGSDSLGFLKNDFHINFPQHPPFYILLIAVIRHFLVDLYWTFQSVKFLQYLIFLFSAYYLINSFSRKIRCCVALFFCMYSSLFVIQSGLFMESMFVSFQLIFLSNCLRYVRQVFNFNRLDWVTHISSLAIMLLIRYSAILFLAFFPLVLIVHRKEISKLPKKIISVGGIYAIVWMSILLLNAFLINISKAIDSSMYGRPGLHKIEHILSTLNTAEKKDLILRWDGKATDSDEIYAHRCIIDTPRIWLGPRTAIYNYVFKNNTNKSEAYCNERTEKLLNQSFLHFILLLDKSISLDVFASFKYFALPMHNTFNSIIESKGPSILSETQNNFEFSKYNKGSTLLYYFNILQKLMETILVVLIIIAIIVILYRGDNSFYWPYFMFIFLHSMLLSLFTVTLPRYCIMNGIVYFSIFLLWINSMAKNFSYRYITAKNLS